MGPRLEAVDMSAILINSPRNPVYYLLYLESRKY